MNRKIWLLDLFTLLAERLGLAIFLGLTFIGIWVVALFSPARAEAAGELLVTEFRTWRLDRALARHQGLL